MSTLSSTVGDKAHRSVGLQLLRLAQIRATHLRIFSASRASASKRFSTAAASTSSSASSSTNEDASKDSSSDGKKSKKDDSNLFLDNLGKIFLSSIGLVLVMLLRSTKSNNSRTELCDAIESSALLDPLEIDDLRWSNEDFTVDVWEKIVEEIKRELLANRDKGRGVTYPEFLSVVTRAMKEYKGEGFTIQFGHLVDRVVIAELERTAAEGGDTAGENESAAVSGSGKEGQELMQKELPLPFLFAALSLALNSTITDRVRVLFESMPQIEDNAANPTISNEQVCEMVQHLQNTCQLVPGAQVVETNSKVPYQTYRVGTGDELVKRAREGYGGKKGSVGVTEDKDGPVSLEDFHAILKSRTVCAWGECYVKKVGKTTTSDR